MSAQPICHEAVRGRSENPHYVINNHLDGLLELGDSSLIRGNASASTQRLAKNVFDSYGVGEGGCTANAVGQSV